MDDITFAISRIVATIIGLVFAYYLIPLFKQAIEKANNEKLVEFINAAVYAAQQTLESGAIKKKFVQTKLSNWLETQNIKITPEQIDILIESAVLAMKSTIK